MCLKKLILPLILVCVAIPCIALGAQDKQTTSEDVITWMYDNWLSIYSTTEAFKPDTNIRRDEAAKFITVFAQNMLDKQWEETPACYTFSDVNEKNSLQRYILQSCELWYMKWNNNTFNPSGKLTNEQAIAIIIRANDWRLEEPTSDRSANYYAKAKELGITDWLDISKKTAAISRWSFATLLYRTSQSWRWSQLINGIGTMIKSFIDMLWIKVNSNTGITKEFITQASVCLSWASTVTQADFDMMGINFHITSYRQIRWFDGNLCKIYERTESAKIKVTTGILLSAISSGATQAEIDQQIATIESGVQAAVGQDGICTYATWILVENLKNELSGESLPMGDLGNKTDNCTWALYESNQQEGTNYVE